jgi:predicted nucleic acid-binding protein
MNFVLDASVAAKWFNIEESSDTATQVKDAHVRGDLELAAPSHLVYEVGNSIWMNSQLTTDDAREAVASILQLGIFMLPPSTSRASRAMEIARLNRTTFYDASYLQAAEELKATLLTADETQARACMGVVQVLRLPDFKA